ncbi:hypothetical protein DENSPDRAFT_224386 [Dentipellis sp. KUC8613]|nr:hypothetical protein DENSPDRAFT_224386 [Dentipellis sp. KUC8613]
MHLHMVSHPQPGRAVLNNIGSGGDHQKDPSARARSSVLSPCCPFQYVACGRSVFIAIMRRKNCLCARASTVVKLEARTSKWQTFFVLRSTFLPGPPHATVTADSAYGAAEANPDSHKPSPGSTSSRFPYKFCSTLFDGLVPSSCTLPLTMIIPRGTLVLAGFTSPNRLSMVYICKAHIHTRPLRRRPHKIPVPSSISTAVADSDAGPRLDLIDDTEEPAFADYRACSRTVGSNAAGSLMHIYTGHCAPPWACNRICRSIHTALAKW